MFKLRDEGGRVYAAATERGGKVFVLLPDEMLANPPERLLVQNEPYVLKRSSGASFEIENLGISDLDDFADSKCIVEGRWQ